MIPLTLAYDMRAPAFGASAERLYQAMLDQCAWADANGFHRISFMEHHASTDGYLPSPIVAAAAAAGRTKTVGIGISLMLLPLYDPLRAAEDLAVLDLVSGGRLSLAVGAGYREEEYAQFGLDFKKRPSRMETAILTLKQAWTGEPFEYQGRTVRILPKPAQPGGPKITLGGTSEAAARRAARIADGFAPFVPRYFDVYREELIRLGKPAPPPMVQREGAMFVHVSRDPDRDWARIAPHALHESNDYAAWAKGDPQYPYPAVIDADTLRASGLYRVLTPEQAVEFAIRAGGLSLKPTMGGMDPDLARQSLDLVAAEVLPALRRAA